MTAPAPAENDPAGSDGVSTIGLALSTVTLIAVAVPVTQGLADPAVWLAASFALIATATFVARRYELFEPLFGGPLAAASSGLVVVLSGYALTQHVFGSVTVPGLGWSIPFFFVAFLGGAAAVSVGVADAAGIGIFGLRQRTARFLEMIGVGLLGLVGMFVATRLLSVPAGALLGELSMLQWQVVQYLGFALGIGAVAVGYLALREYGLSYIDLEMPSVRSIGWMVGGLGVLFGVLFGGSMVMAAAGVETAGHGTVDAVEQNAELLAVIIPASLLIIGPFEELLYRNVIQKSLYETFSRYGSVVVTSVVFALVHVLAYATAGPGQILAALSMIFVLSIVLGVIYERTENLLVPAVVHGVFNAVQFSSLYLQL